MSPEQQRIAIAEACGWVWYRMPNSERDSRGPLRCLFHPDIHEYEGQIEAWKVRADGTERICNIAYMESEGYLPDYLNDLNAIHQVYTSIRPELANNSAAELEKIVMFGANPHFSREWHLATSTAAQRAEAFLRTIGKWQDKPLSS